MLWQWFSLFWPLVLVRTFMNLTKNCRLATDQANLIDVFECCIWGSHDVFLGKGLFCMYYLLLFSDRSLFRTVEEQYAFRIEAMKQNANIKGGYDEYAEPGNDDTRAMDYRPMGRPNLTYKLKIILGFFQVLMKKSWIVC